MNKIDIGTFEIISTTIDNSSRRIEELKNEILSCTVDIKKIGEDTGLGQLLGKRVEFLTDERNKLIDQVIELRKFAVSNGFDNYVFNTDRTEFDFDMNDGNNNMVDTSAENVDVQQSSYTQEEIQSEKFVDSGMILLLKIVVMITMIIMMRN